MRLPLPEGQWAELRERLTYEQGREVYAAFIAVDKDRAALVDLNIVLVRNYVSAWSVRDLDGADVPLEAPEGAPWDTLTDIAAKAIDIYKGRKDPKAGAGRSTTTSPARRSR